MLRKTNRNGTMVLESVRKASEDVPTVDSQVDFRMSAFVGVLRM